MKLKILDSTFSVIKLPPFETIPLWALNCDIFSITRTDEELSVVCPSECLPINDWKCIKVEGILDFTCKRQIGHISIIGVAYLTLTLVNK